MVVVGLTLGLETVEVKPDGLDVHAYVFPTTEEAPMDVLALLQIEALLPALADGNEFTVTVTLFELVHPVAVMVSVNV